MTSISCLACLLLLLPICSGWPVCHLLPLWVILGQGLHPSEVLGRQPVCLGWMSVHIGQCLCPFLALSTTSELPAKEDSLSLWLLTPVVTFICSSFLLSWCEFVLSHYYSIEYDYTVSLNSSCRCQLATLFYHTQMSHTNPKHKLTAGLANSRCAIYFKTFHILTDRPVWEDHIYSTLHSKKWHGSHLVSEHLSGGWTEPFQFLSFHTALEACVQWFPPSNQTVEMAKEMNHSPSAWWGSK